jgi:hypothetical protein
MLNKRKMTLLKEHRRRCASNKQACDTVKYLETKTKTRKAEGDRSFNMLLMPTPLILS